MIEVDPDDSPFISGATEAGVIVFGEVAVGENFTVNCNNSDSEEVFYVRNIDVVINENTNFSEMDLEASRRIFLHEFGHAHLLQHASRLFGTGDVQKLMYYTGGVQNNSITSADFNGAVSVFPASVELLGNDDSDSCPNPIEAAGCPNSTNEVHRVFDIVLSPNPFRNDLWIESNIPLNEDVELKIHTITGSLLFEKEVRFGKKVELSGLSFLPSGLYFLSLQNSSFGWSGKIIKK